MSDKGYFENLREGLKTETVARRYFVKKIFFNISQNLQAYSELSQPSKMEIFTKMVDGFRKKLHLRCLTWF